MTIKDHEEQLVRVVAPSNLNEGYVFQATTSDGRFVTVKVPTGGVVEGQVFDAEVLVDVEAPPVVEAVVLQAEPDEAVGVDLRVQVPTASATAEPEFTVPTGAWRHDLFSCFDACSSGIFWMTCCFSYVALGQLLQRMKLNFVGSESRESYKSSCLIWTTMMSVVIILTFLPWDNFEDVTVYLAIEAVITILAIIALTQVRYYIRRKYSIPADCCANSGFLSDCCCMWWCSCCGIIQMLRHTHDEEKYMYTATSPTGLDSDAPEIV